MGADTARADDAERPAFADESVRRMLQLVGRSREWFAGKTALDAGCGNGRWSITLARLGARVTAIDISAAGLAEVARLGADFPGFATVRSNILDAIPLSERFDLVWHFGVAHHTGDTRRALQNVCRMAKPGGMVLTMIYGEPCWERPGEFAELNAHTEIRRAISAMSIPDRVAYLQQRFGDVDAHGWFDAASPKINDLHRFDEIREWLTAWGFGKSSASPTIGTCTSEPSLIPSQARRCETSCDHTKMNKQNQAFAREMLAVM